MPFAVMFAGSGECCETSAEMPRGVPVQRKVEDAQRCVSRYSFASLRDRLPWNGLPDWCDAQVIGRIGVPGTSDL